MFSTCGSDWGAIFGRVHAKPHTVRWLVRDWPSATRPIHLETPHRIRDDVHAPEARFHVSGTSSAIQLISNCGSKMVPPPPSLLHLV